jgi:hypothetical protein
MVKRHFGGTFSLHFHARVPWCHVRCVIATQETDTLLHYDIGIAWDEGACSCRSLATFRNRKTLWWGHKHLCRVWNWMAKRNVPARSPLETHCFSITKASELMLCREIIAVYSEVHTKHINSGKVRRFWMLKAVVLILTTLLLGCSSLGRSLRIFMPPSSPISYHIAFQPVCIPSVYGLCSVLLFFVKIPIYKGDCPSVRSKWKSVSIGCFVRVQSCFWTIQVIAPWGQYLPLKVKKTKRVEANTVAQYMICGTFTVFFWILNYKLRSFDAVCWITRNGRSGSQISRTAVTVTRSNVKIALP